MECNKDDAMKAMQIAEKKLQEGEFMGAKKMAQRAHRLFPPLENITQLLTVCDIHCAAQSKICGTDNDWYGILQIEQSADEAIIRKQYRKLALLLHPDKNKFAGAEAAFKLVGEANRLLSDQSKRHLYDLKYKVATRNIAPPKPSRDQPNGYRAVNPDNCTANGYSNAPHSQFTGSSYNAQEPQAFWTCCPFCGVRYQYLKLYLNKMLRCQNCGRGFISHDLNNQPVPSAFQQNHASQKKVASEPGLSKSSSQSKRGSDLKSRDKFSGGNQTSKVPHTFGNDLDTKAGKRQKIQRPDVDDRQGGSNKPKTDADVTMKQEKSGSNANKKQGASKVEIKKRHQKPAVRSSNDCENAKEDEGDLLFEKDPGASKDDYFRRSLRQKNNTSYKKYLSDDNDLGDPQNKSNCSQSMDESGKMKDATRDVKSSVADGFVDDHNKSKKCKIPASVSGASPNRKPKSDKFNVTRNGTNTPDKIFEVGDSDADADRQNTQKVQFVSCADPEFSNFDKDRAENCFSVNQIWAIYDSHDGMPRFYAQIKKVFTPAFKVEITWFEPNPIDKNEIDWCDAELPIACGKHSIGNTEETVDLPMFSHVVHSIKRMPRNAYLMYPKKGETWALFKHWDFSWISDPQKHRPYEFEFVEILADYVENVGILVSYLDKIKGFVCLFHRTEERGLSSAQIPPNELYRFSHQIPSFRMTGEERKGVPKGSFELDPASLPPNINEYDKYNDIKMQTCDVLPKSDDDLSRVCYPPEDEVDVIEPKNIQPNSNPKKKKNPKSLKNDVEGIESKNTQATKKQKKNSQSEASLLRKSPRKLNVSKNDPGANVDHQSMTGDDKNKDVNRGSFPLHKESGKNDVERENMILRRSPRDLSKKNAG